MTLPDVSVNMSPVSFSKIDRLVAGLTGTAQGEGPGLPGTLRFCGKNRKFS